MAHRSKYEPIRKHLESCTNESVPMTFGEVERVLGFKLPAAKQYPAWWSNNWTNNVMTKEWLAAGFKTEQVDVRRGKLVFRRTGRNGVQRKPVTEAQHQLRDITEQPRPHPLFGWMKGTFTVVPGSDLGEPADPDWADIAHGAALPAEDPKGRV